MTTARGIRNNNPGNIRYVDGITSTYLGCIGSDGEFCIFDTAINGIRALCRLLLVYQNKHGLDSLRGIINRWAPPVENDTSAYVRHVCSLVGCGPDVHIDLSTDAMLSSVAAAIITHENAGNPYTDDLLRSAARLALNKPAEPVPTDIPEPPRPPWFALVAEWVRRKTS